MQYPNDGLISRFFSKSRHLAAILALVLIAAGCSKAEDPPPAPAPTVDEVVDGPGFHLQDMWMFFDITGMDASGNTESILDDLIAEVSSQAGEPVALTEFLNFSPLPDIEAAMVSPDGEILEEVEISFGLFGMPDGYSDPAAGELTLGFVTSAPTTVRNVMGGDELVLNLDQFESTQNYETVLLDFAMGQARPVADESGLDALETLQARFEGGSITWVGSDADGNLEPAMWRGVPGSKVSPAALAFSDEAELTTNTAQLTTGVNVTGSTSMSPLILPAPVPARGSGPSGFGVKPAFKGKGGLALTVFCLAGTLIVTGGAGVLFGSVFCTLIGGMGALNDAINAIDDNNGGGNPHPGPGGGFWGDPHITTFDGANQPLMLIGEFDAAISAEMRLQLRTAATSQDSNVSYNVAAAIEADGAVIIADATAESEQRFRLDGEPLTLESSEQHEMENGVTISRFGNSYDVTAPSGHAVVLTMHGASLDAHYYLPKDHAPGADEVTGLLGDADGDVENDFFARDGSTIEDFTLEQFYGEIAESWRVSDEDNLFDSPLTHDRSFPTAKPDPDENVIAWATKLCTGMGLSGYYLEACITDVAATLDAAYVMRAMEGQAVYSPETFNLAGPGTDAGGAADAAIQLDGMHAKMQTPYLDDAGHVLVAMQSLDDRSGVLVALDEDGSTAWQIPMEDTSCGFAVSGNRALVPNYSDANGEKIFVLQLIDTQDGSEIDIFSADHLVQRNCTELTVTDDLIIGASVGDAGRIIGINPHTEDAVFDTEIANMQSKVIASGDGNLWAITDDGNSVLANQIDPETGTVTSKTKLPATGLVSPEKSISATEDGFIAVLKEGATDVMLRFTGSNTAWVTEFPIDVGDKSYGAPSRISSDDHMVAGYSGDSRVLAFDIETGEAVNTITPSSFNNNGSQIALHAGNVVVAPFGGDAWVEIYDPRTGDQVWSTPAPSGIPTNDAKAIHSLDEGRILIQGGKDDHALIAIYAVP